MTRYWLTTFSEDAWRHFLGLPEPALEATSPRTHVGVGDVLLCYVRGEGRRPGQWVGAERVTSPMRDDEPIRHAGGVWPWRWAVEPAVPRRDCGQGVPGKRLVDELTMFRAIDPKHWGSALGRQGREIPAEDGEFLVRLLGDQGWRTKPE